MGYRCPAFKQNLPASNAMQVELGGGARFFWPTDSSRFQRPDPAADDMGVISTPGRHPDRGFPSKNRSLN